MSRHKEPGCVFCEAVTMQGFVNVVRSWPDALAFVPLNPVTPGHVLVVPRQHVRDVTEDPEVSALTMRRAAELAEPDCNVITSAGAAATQTVWHLHLHMVPRRSGDGLPLPWTADQARAEGAAEQAARVKALRPAEDEIGDGWLSVESVRAALDPAVAEQYRQRVRAEALRDAADAWETDVSDPTPRTGAHADGWLRRRADREAGA